MRACPGSAPRTASFGSSSPPEAGRLEAGQPGRRPGQGGESSGRLIVDGFDRRDLDGEPAHWPPARAGEAPPQRPPHGDVITGRHASQRSGETGVPDSAIDDIDRVAARSLGDVLPGRDDGRRLRDGSPDDQPEGREAAPRSKNSLGGCGGQPSGENNLVSIRMARAGDGRPLLLDAGVPVLASDPISAGIPTGGFVFHGTSGLVRATACPRAGVPPSAPPAPGLIGRRRTSASNAVAPDGAFEWIHASIPIGATRVGGIVLCGASGRPGALTRLWAVMSRLSLGDHVCPLVSVTEAVTGEVPALQPVRQPVADSLTHLKGL